MLIEKRYRIEVNCAEFEWHVDPRIEQISRSTPTKGTADDSCDRPCDDVSFHGGDYPDGDPDVDRDGECDGDHDHGAHAHGDDCALFSYRAPCNHLRAET